MPADDSAQIAFDKWARLPGEQDPDLLERCWLEAWRQGRQEGFEARYAQGRRETAEEDADGD